MEIMEMTERGVPRWRTEPELLIFARNREGAQRAANLLFAAIPVFEGQSLFLEEIIAVPEDEDERGEYPPSLSSTPSRRPPLLEMPAQSLACAANGAGGTGRTLPPASTRTAGCDPGRRLDVDEDARAARKRTREMQQRPPSTRKHAGQRSSPRLASMVACGLARRSPRKFVNIQPPAGVAAGRARRGLSSAIDQNVIVHAQRHLLRRSNCPLLCNFRQ